MCKRKRPSTKFSPCLEQAIHPLANASEEAHRQERDAYLADAKKFNLTGIEDYIGWSVVEPEQGKPNWGAYREDAAAIKKAGYQVCSLLCGSRPCPSG